MNRWIFSIFLAASVAAGGTAVQAKSLARIIAETGLSPEDFEVLSATSEALLNKGTPQVGNQASWVNQDTGTKGTVRIRDVKGSCVHLQNFVQTAEEESAREIRTRRCRDAGGNWILTP